MALSVEPDALDTLLSLQLRIVEEQLGRRRATDGAGDVWHQELAARQKRLDELDRQNARMAQELDRAVTQGPRARPPPAPPPQPPLDTELKAMLEKSVGLHNELMENLRAGAAEEERRRREAAEEERLWREELETAENSKMSDDIDEAGRDRYLPPPPPPSQPQPLHGEGGQGAGEEAAEKLLGEIDAALQDVDLSSDSEADLDEAGSPRKQDATPAGITDEPPGGSPLPRVPPRRAGSEASLSTFDPEEEEEDAPPPEAEVSEVLLSFVQCAIPWLKRAVRPVVSSMLRDASLQLDMVGERPQRRASPRYRRQHIFSHCCRAQCQIVGPCGRNHSPQRDHSPSCAGEAAGLARGRRFTLRPSTKPTAEIDKQCSKLRVRTKALLEVVLEALSDAPAPMLGHLRYLTSRRLHWPNDALMPSVAGTLEPHHDGSSSPTATSPLAITMQVGPESTRVPPQPP